MKKDFNGDFVAMERDILKFWDDNHSFEKLKEQNKKTGKYYAFLDGPITANNEMKLHHAWNRSLKDIMLRYKGMNGFDAHYQNGFDAQGLWVEVNVEKALGLQGKPDIIKFGMDKFTEECMSRVKYFANRITEQSKRLGQWMNWDDSYMTNSDNNITSIWYFLKKCYDKGWLIEKYRPMPWCAHCGTSLSEHELADSYKDMEHEAVFFKLPIKDSNYSILVWTTTPWTLSANVAVAVNPDLEYSICKVTSDSRQLIVCSQALKVLRKDLVEVVKTVKGSELVGLEYETCFNKFPCQTFKHTIVAWEAVDATEGSGAVHIAPGCGAEDFELGQKLGLNIIVPVDENGEFLGDFDFLSGKKTSEVADEVFEHLKNDNKLYYTHKYTHRYPICWRCKNPLIFRLSKEWYIAVDEIRPKLLEAIETVKWQPAFLKERMRDWLTNMGDWNISRKRFYGLPLPFYRCEKCGELTVVDSLDTLAKLSSKEEVDALPHLHRPYIDNIKITCPKCNAKVSRVPEVGDCWLDAGITPFSTKKYFTDKEFWKKNFPAECVIEMKEQIRLWFYCILFMAVTIEERAPYKKVIGFATLVAEDGSKFSKSGPNNIDFNVIVEQVGADVIRYVFAGNNMQNDTRFGMSVCEEARRKIMGLWNAFVFFDTYASIDNPRLDAYKPNEDTLTVSDKWLIQRTNDFIDLAIRSYDDNQYFVVVDEFEKYTDDLTNWYIRINRRRFWKSEDNDDKLNAYYCLYYALKNTIQIMTPIIPFMSEYIWQEMVRVYEPAEKESVMLGGFAKRTFEINDKTLLFDTEVARNIITLAQRLRNENQIKVKQPLRNLYYNGDASIKDAVTRYEQIIKDELNIKELTFEPDTSKYNDAYLTLDFKKAGAVLKGDVQKVKNILTGLSQEDMDELVRSLNNPNIDIPTFGNVASDMFIINYRPKKEFVVATEKNITIALDITIDEDLMIEGLSRELIRQIQVLRKDSGYSIEQRIILSVSSDSEIISKVMTTYKQKIMQEVLAVSIKDLDSYTAEREVDLDGNLVVIRLKEVDKK